MYGFINYHDLQAAKSIMFYYRFFGATPVCLEQGSHKIIDVPCHFTWLVVVPSDPSGPLGDQTPLA